MTRSKAVEVVRLTREKEVDPSRIVLSTGVVLRAIPVPPMFLSDIVARMNPLKPSVPIVFVQSKGREEENPNDPTYIEAKNTWQTSLVTEINNAFILLGTEVISSPKNVPTKDDESWLGKMRVLKALNTSDPLERYLAWVKYVAAPTEGDIELLISSVGRLSGVSEEDVQEAVDKFQRND